MYCGDEDNGQTSAWYVFSALGFYPVAPGTNQYALGSPLFRKATLRLENGRSLVIEARNQGPKNVYVRALSLNGRPLARTWIGHEELLRGGHLVFEMAPTPNLQRGIQAEDRPYSFSLDPEAARATSN
jgi:putative alpha-1,2-mannosidase